MRKTDEGTTMHDQTHADGRSNRVTGDATGAESGTTAAAVRDGGSENGTGSTANKNVLYGRSVPQNTTDNMASDNARDNDEGSDHGNQSDEKPSPQAGDNERVRTRVKEDGDEESEDEEESEVTEDEEEVVDSCPECSGRVQEDAQHGERACSECGLVIEDEQIDHGPEWRSFNQQEENNRRRVGSPSTLLQHDKGLSTNIGSSNKDGYGNPLSPKRRRQMSRLRKWNERFRTRNSEERNLRTAIGDIRRIASKLDVPKDVAESGVGIYRRCLRNDLIRGRAIESMIEASLFLACRQAGVPRTLDEFEEVSQVSRQRIARGRRYISLELGLEIEPPNPADYVESVGSGVETTIPVRELAREMVEHLVDGGGHSGKHPTGVAASAIYTADELVAGGNLTQTEVADVANITEVTIRNRQEDLMEVTDSEVVEKYREQYEAIQDESEDEEGNENGTGDDVEEDTEADNETSETEAESEEISDRTSIVVDFGDEDRTQSQVMLDGVQKMVEEHDLLDQLGGGEYCAPRCSNPLIVPEQNTEDQHFGTWHEIGDEMCVNTKLNTDDKKRRLSQLGDECAVEVQITD